MPTDELVTSVCYQIALCFLTLVEHSTSVNKLLCTHMLYSVFKSKQSSNIELLTSFNAHNLLSRNPEYTPSFGNKLYQTPPFIGDKLCLNAMRN